MDKLKILLTEGDSWTAGDIIDPRIKEDLAGNVNAKINDNYRLPKVWPHKLATKLGVKSMNTAVAGSSNDGIVRRVIDNVLNLLKNYEPQEIKVVIGLTSPERKDFYHKKDNDYGWDVLYPLDSSELSEERSLFKKVYSSIYWNKEEYISRYLQSVFLIHQFLQYKGIDHTFFNAFYQDNDGKFGFDLHSSIDLLEASMSRSYLKHLNIYSLIDVYREIVENYFCLTSFKGYLDKFGKNHCFDGMHPNEQGHDIWAEYLYQYFTKKDLPALHDAINLARLDKPTEEILYHYRDVPEINDIDANGHVMVRPIFSQTNIDNLMKLPNGDLAKHDKGRFTYHTMIHHDTPLVASCLHKLPEKVLEGLRTGDCKLILDDSLEGKPIFQFLSELYKNTDILGLNRKNIVYVTNNLFAERDFNTFKTDNSNFTEHINVISYLYNVVDIKRLKDPKTGLEYKDAYLPKFVDIEEEIKYKTENLNTTVPFLKVNRTGRPERNLFMLYVNEHNLYHKFKISFPKYNNEFYSHEVKELFPSLVTDENIESLKEKIPFDIDESDIHNHGEPGGGKGFFNADLPFRPIHYRNTFISVVFCAFPMDKACHLHSSTFNPMYCGHPVIQFGPKGHLEELRKRGFKTFGKWWDESYDDIEDDWLRFEYVCKIVHRLSTKTKQQFLDMYIDMKDVLQHNSNFIFNYDTHNNLTNKVLYNDEIFSSN
jgi:hypothetical protein